MSGAVPRRSPQDSSLRTEREEEEKGEGKGKEGERERERPSGAAVSTRRVLRNAPRSSGINIHAITRCFNLPQRCRSHTRAHTHTFTLIHMHTLA